MDPRNQFSISMPHGWFENEWALIRTPMQAVKNPPTMPDNNHQPRTLLYGPDGQVLMQTAPRQFGFRPPR